MYYRFNSSSVCSNSAEGKAKIQNKNSHYKKHNLLIILSGFNRVDTMYGFRLLLYIVILITLMFFLKRKYAIYCICDKHFTFWSFPLKVIGQLEPNVAGMFVGSSTINPYFILALTNKHGCHRQILFLIGLNFISPLLSSCKCMHKQMRE